MIARAPGTRHVIGLLRLIWPAAVDWPAAVGFYLPRCSAEGEAERALLLVVCLSRLAPLRFLVL